MSDAVAFISNLNFGANISKRVVLDSQVPRRRDGGVASLVSELTHKKEKKKNTQPASHSHAALNYL